MADDKQKAEDGIIRFDFPLKTPINVFGEMVSVLKWREPSGADLIKVGNPVIAYPGTVPLKIEHDMVKVAAMMARLTDAPSSSIERVDPEDLIKFAWTITGFFLPGR